jgi:hypothetical protein
MDYVMAIVKIPKEWLGATIDQNAQVGAFVKIYDDTWEVNVRYVNFPGWYVFNLKPEFKRELYDMIDQACIEKYLENKQVALESEYDYHD